MSLQIIGGEFKGRPLVGVKSALLKPTTGRVRELLFALCQNSIEGALFLDLFAGVGACGLEAISRGARKVYFVEREKKHAAAIKQNIASLGVEKYCHLLVKDVFRACRDFEKRGLIFDIIFADPPYGTKESSLSNQLLKLIDEGNLLKSGGRLFLEDHKDAANYEEPLIQLKEQKRRGFGNIVLRELRLNRL